MKFTRRDGIIGAWSENGAFDDTQYIPLIQSLSMNVSTNVSTLSLSGTYKKRHETLTAPTVECSMEILAKDTVFNEELGFLQTPTESRKSIFKNINEPLQFSAFLNDQDGDLIDALGGETYGFFVSNCYLDSYSLSIQAGSLGVHTISFSGDNISSDKVDASENIQDLRPKNIALASRTFLYDGESLFPQPVTDFSMEFSVDRKTKYLFPSSSTSLEVSSNKLLAPRLNDAESSVTCDISVATTMTNEEYLERSSDSRELIDKLFKDFKIVIQDSDDAIPNETTLFFHNAILNELSVDQSIDGLMTLNYRFSVVAPTSGHTYGEGIEIMSRKEKYSLCKNSSDLFNVLSTYKNDVIDGIWDWNLDSLQNGSYAFNDTASSTTITVPMTEFRTESLPSLTNGNNMFQQRTKFKFLSKTPNLKSADLMFSCRGLGINYGFDGEYNESLPELTTAHSMFEGCENLTSFKLTAPKLTNAYQITLECKNLKSIYLDAPNVTNFSYAFNTTSACEKYEFPSGFENATTIYSIFDASNLSECPWTFPKATNAAYAFQKCKNLKELVLTLPVATDVRNFTAYCDTLQKLHLDAPKAINLNEIARNCPYLTDVKVKHGVTLENNKSSSTSIMFYNCLRLQKVDIDTSAFRNLSYFGERTGLTEFDHDCSNVVYGNNAFMYNSGGMKMSVFRCEFPKLEEAERMFANLPYTYEFAYPVDVNGDCIWRTGLPQDGDKVKYLTLPSLVRADNMFVNCRLYKNSAISILNSLREKDETIAKTANDVTPDWKISMGIHVDYKEDEEVLQAIENARNKGWTVTIGWHGTPGTAPYGVSSTPAVVNSRTRERIFIKKELDSCGDYTDKNGDKWFITSGHDVNNPDEWEVCDSVEEKLKEWGLEYTGTIIPEDIH